MAALLATSSGDDDFLERGTRRIGRNLRAGRVAVNEDCKREYPNACKPDIWIAKGIACARAACIVWREFLLGVGVRMAVGFAYYVDWRWTMSGVSHYPTAPGV